MGGGGQLHDFVSQCMAGGLQVLSLFIGLGAESLAYVPHDAVLYNVLTRLLCAVRRASYYPAWEGVPVTVLRYTALALFMCVYAWPGSLSMQCQYSQD
jgi:hypothetical protein